MNILFVVSREQDWPDDIPGIRVLPAPSYLLDPACGDAATKVFNLCSTYRYQSEGYYVSLLAEARGHQPLPDVAALKELQSEDLATALAEQLGRLEEFSFAQAEAEVFDLDIYFGRDPDQRHEHLCQRIFELLRAPILHARFERAHGRWHLCSVRAGSADDIPEHRRAFFMQAALEYLQTRKIRNGKPPAERPSLAILCDPASDAAPSNAEAIRKFRDAAGVLGMSAEILTCRDTSRLTDFDALFIRDTTNVNHPTYQWSRRAADSGMVAIDDPDSILRCTNKIYLFELLSRHHIPIPKTLVVHRGNADRIVPTLGLPCILKQPDGAFSLGVVKIESERQLHQKVEQMLKSSELILAQEWLPTPFDWRIAVLDRRPLFVCKYYMARGHWQVIKHDRQQKREGRVEALSVGEAPDEVIQTALAAANLIGDGFYGVDLKQVGNQYYVIEINDNPNVDAGNEDAVLGDALYREVMGVFRKRIDARKGRAAP